MDSDPLPTTTALYPCCYRDSKNVSHLHDRVYRETYWRARCQVPRREVCAYNLVAHRSSLESASESSMSGTATTCVMVSSIALSTVGMLGNLLVVVY